MKKRCFAAALALLAAGAFGQEAEVQTIDGAVGASMSYLIGRLAPGTKVAITNFAAFPSVSNYVVEELITYLVDDGTLTVVDRSNLEMLQKEMNFQLSGEVSDASAQAIGKKLGAQTIISGSLSPLGNMWRMRIKALEVETARIQGTRTYTIRKDVVLSNLLPKTAGDKLASGALNIVFGLGSYLDGDLAGGLTITGGYVAAAGLFVIEAVALDRDSPAAGVPATLGIAVAGATLVYGFVRPFIYERAPQLAAVLDNFHVEAAPVLAAGNTVRDGLGVRLAYTAQF
jgi:TolB-like protein